MPITWLCTTASASLCHNPADGRYLFAEGGRVTAGRWYHLAAVARPAANGGPAMLTVFLNGRAVGSATFDGTIKAVDGEAIGLGDSAGAPSPGARFRGYVDELAVWHRPLEPAEIAAHFQRRAALLRELERGRRQAERERLAAAAARLQRFGCEEIVFAERFPGRDSGAPLLRQLRLRLHRPEPLAPRPGRRGAVQAEPADRRRGAADRRSRAARSAIRKWTAHGRTILFSYRPGGDHYYHLYEIGVDGSGLRQITDGPWDDIEPAYLPDGDIVFCSSRAKRYIGCWLAQAATLHRCDPAGGNLRMLSSGSFTENTPCVLPDGRVLYTRWEYVNRDPVSFHHLWTMNPDGSSPRVFFGNQTPGGVFIDARPVPGVDRVAFIHSPGHGQNEHAGYVAMVGGRSGPNAPQAMLQLSREADFRDPFPLAEDTAAGSPRESNPADGRSGPHRGVVHRSDQDVHEPIAVLPHPREPAVAPRVDARRTTGTILLADVYTGRNMAGVNRGAVKKLLVLEDLPKPANYHGGGSQPIGHGVTSTLKRILGTVPVEEDGSAYFEVPALRSLYFATARRTRPLDQADAQLRHGAARRNGRLRRLPRDAAADARRGPADAAGDAAAAAGDRAGRRRAGDSRLPARHPADPRPALRPLPPGHARRRDGGVSLAGDRGPVFSHSYYELLLHWQVKDTGGPPMHGTGRQPGNDAPYTTYSSASPLMNKIDFSHYEVQLDPREAATVRLWIDTERPIRGHLRRHRHRADRRLLERERADPRDGRRLAFDAAGCGSGPPPLRRLPRRPLAAIRHGQDADRRAPGFPVVAEAAEPVLAAPRVQSHAAGEIAGPPGAAGSRGRRLRRRVACRSAAADRRKPAPAAAIRRFIR